MYVETIGYVKVKEQDIDRVHDWIEENNLYALGERVEVVTNVNPEAINQIVGDLLTKEEADTLISRCDSIKFYVE